MGEVFGLDVRWSAYKHGVTDDDMAHAYTNAIRYVEFDFRGEDRILLIGPARSGELIELVLVPVGDPVRIIHANVLQPNHYDYLRWSRCPL